MHICLLILLWSVSYLCQAEIYRYQDNNGKWHYTDKKPKPQQKAETLEIEKNAKRTYHKPSAFYQQASTQAKGDNEDFTLVLHNPYFAPVEFRLYGEGFHEGEYSKVVAADSIWVVNRYPAQSYRPEFHYSYRLGDPSAQHSNPDYQPPVPDNQYFRVSQSFGGRFSHTSAYSKYAVDIALPVGTYLHAARGGTVVSAKDDYPIGGVSSKFFLDKANYVRILHDDGTIAVYAHILLGSLQVKPGDKVATGQVIARSGSTGYSSGPHLHFAVHVNKGMKVESVPFTFLNEGQRVTPTRGMKLIGGTD